MKTMLLVQAVLSVALLCDAATNNHPEGVQFSADGTRIVTTSSNNTVRLWDARIGKPLEALPEQILRNKTIIHRYFEEWANRGNAAVADELIATNLVLRNPPAILRSLEDYKNGMVKFHSAFPDARFTVEEQIAEGDKVAARCSVQGKHEGEFLGKAATQSPIELTGMTIVRIDKGKIVEAWNNFDFMTLHKQVGLL